jgi:hypothetical protein
LLACTRLLFFVGTNSSFSPTLTTALFPMSYKHNWLWLCVPVSVCILNFRTLWPAWWLVKLKCVCILCVSYSKMCAGNTFRYLRVH